MIIIACSCGQGVIADDRETGTARLTEHMIRGSLSCPHVGYIGEADAKATLTVATEVIGGPHADL